MKIGFDISQTGTARAGCGYFAYSLAGALAERAEGDQFVLYPTFGNFFRDPDWKKSTFTTERKNFRRGLGHNDFHELREFWTAPPKDFEERLGAPDVIHANNFFCPRNLRHARLVYTLYDLSFLENPDWTSEANRIGCFEGVFQASLHADHIVAISRFSKQHFLEVFPHYPEDRITVIYPASRYGKSRNVPRPKSLAHLQPGRFWVCVGTLEPRKNHARLLEAYAKLKAHAGRVLPLVLAGGKGWLLDQLSQTITDLGLAADIFMTGYIDDDAVQWLYQHCHAVLYPSLFEGFGLPVVEAMSLGAAVITSNVTSIPEIAGDAAMLVDPYRPHDIFAAMLRLTNDDVLRESLRQRAPRQTRRFCWQTAALDTLQCYKQVVNAPRFRSAA